MEPWFDTHVHLDRYDEVERERLLRRAGEAGVSMICVAVDLLSSAAVVALAARSAAVAAAVVGVHPRWATGWDHKRLEALARAPSVRGIGECGFDGAGPEWAVQAEAFVAQCGLARELDRALVVHIDGEGAWDHLVDHEPAMAGLRVVRHYFTGDEAQAAWHAARGHYLSFGNPLRRDPRLREIARNHPEGLLLIETDSYPLAGRNTQPADVAKVGETLALVRGWTFAEGRARLAANTRAAFRLAR